MIWHFTVTRIKIANMRHQRREDSLLPDPPGRFKPFMDALKSGFTQIAATVGMICWTMYTMLKQFSH